MGRMEALTRALNTLKKVGYKTPHQDDDDDERFGRHPLDTDKSIGNTKEKVYSSLTGKARLAAVWKQKAVHDEAYQEFLADQKQHQEPQPQQHQLDGHDAGQGEKPPAPQEPPPSAPSRELRSMKSRRNSTTSYTVDLCINNCNDEALRPQSVNTSLTNSTISTSSSCGSPFATDLTRRTGTLSSSGMASMAYGGNACGSNGPAGLCGATYGRQLPHLSPLGDVTRTRSSLDLEVLRAGLASMGAGSSSGKGMSDGGALLAGNGGSGVDGSTGGRTGGSGEGSPKDGRDVMDGGSRRGESSCGSRPGSALPPNAMPSSCFRTSSAAAAAAAAGAHGNAGAPGGLGVSSVGGPTVRLPSLRPLSQHSSLHDSPPSRPGSRADVSVRSGSGYAAVPADGHPGSRVLASTGSGSGRSGTGMCTMARNAPAAAAGGAGGGAGAGGCSGSALTPTLSRRRASSGPFMYDKAQQPPWVAAGAAAAAAAEAGSGVPSVLPSAAESFLTGPRRRQLSALGFAPLLSAPSAPPAAADIADAGSDARHLSLASRRRNASMKALFGDGAVGSGGGGGGHSGALSRRGSMAVLSAQEEGIALDITEDVGRWFDAGDSMYCNADSPEEMAYILDELARSAGQPSGAAAGSGGFRRGPRGSSSGRAGATGCSRPSSGAEGGGDASQFVENDSQGSDGSGGGGAGRGGGSSGGRGSDTLLPRLPAPTAVAPAVAAVTAAASTAVRQGSNRRRSCHLLEQEHSREAAGGGGDRSGGGDGDGGGGGIRSSCLSQRRGSQLLLQVAGRRASLLAAAQQ